MLCQALVSAGHPQQLCVDTDLRMIASIVIAMACAKCALEA